MIDKKLPKEFSPSECDNFEAGLLELEKGLIVPTGYLDQFNGPR